MSVVKSDKSERFAFDMQIKILIIGDSGVGKTCLLLRYANDSFRPLFETTIGIDFKIKHIFLSNKKVKLQMWDTAGQERFRNITTSYFRGAQGIMLLYDVTDKNSLISIRNWLAQIQMHADARVIKILLGCKCDVSDQRAVSREEGEGLAAEYGIKFFEVSNKYNINVDEAFEEISRLVHDRLVADPRAVDEEKVRHFLEKATEVRISGANSWYNKHKINGRYIPTEGLACRAISYRNIDTPNAHMLYKTCNTKHGHWVVVKNKKELARLQTPSYKCLPHIASDGRVWTENYGVYFTRMFEQPTIKCVQLENITQEVTRASCFDIQGDRVSINMDLFLEYSKEPERLGLTVPLFVKYSYIKLASLELQFHALRRSDASDLDRMQELSIKRQEAEHTCKVLLKSLALLGDNTPAVEPSAESILTAIASLQEELALYFAELSDLNNGNFEAARRCRDTQAELAEMAQQLQGKGDSPPPSSPLLSSDAAAVPTGSDNEASSLDGSTGTPTTDAKETEPPTDASKQAVTGALTSPLALADDTLAGASENTSARRIVQDSKNEWTCRIDTVGWMPVHERENRTTMEIEWRCTVTTGLSNTKSTQIGAALTAGMSTICAQLSLDVNWTSSACKQTEHAHLFKIPPNTKLIVEQEVIEGVITLKNSKTIWAMKSKPPKSESFKVSKDSLRIQSATL